MKKTIFTAALLVLEVPFCYAQQDPDDPGIQDSVIVQTVVVDYPMRSVTVDIDFVTDDPVAYINLPLLWTPESDSIYPEDIMYYNNIWGGNWFDSIMYDLHRIHIAALFDTALNTDGTRQAVLGIHFQITNFQSQIITVDSTWDERYGSLIFGLSDSVTEITPAFVPGAIIYDPFTNVPGSSPSPRNFALSQNYPNPFNAQTSIRYSLPETGPVTLSIYNLLGQKVATLFDGVQTAGEHRVVWDAPNFPSGIYFARLETRGQSEAIKIELLK